MAPIVRPAGDGEADHGGHGGGGDEKAVDSSHVPVLFRLPGPASSPASVPKVIGMRSEDALCRLNRS